MHLPDTSKHGTRVVCMLMKPAEPLIRVDILSSLLSRITPLHLRSTGMELPASRFSSQQPVENPSSKEPSTMSTLTMRAPNSLFPSPRDVGWDDRSSVTMSTRPSSRGDRIELPSIRQVSSCGHLKPIYLRRCRLFPNLNTGPLHWSLTGGSRRTIPPLIHRVHRIHLISRHRLV